MLRKQKADQFCRKLVTRLQKDEDMSFSQNEDNILFHLAHGNDQVVVLEALQAKFLLLSNYPEPSKHFVGRRLYYFFRRSFVFQFMSVDCYATVRNCVTCAINRVALRRHNKPKIVFLVFAPLKLVAITILG